MKRVLAAAAILIGLTGAAAAADLTPTEEAMWTEAIQHFQLRSAEARARVIAENRTMCSPGEGCDLVQREACYNSHPDLRFGCVERIQEWKAAADKKAAAFYREPPGGTSLCPAPAYQYDPQNGCRPSRK
jgi:opacity protein-like surface antigen